MMIFCFWSCEELEICAKLKIINFVTHSTSSSSLFDLPDQSGAARVHSYNFLCSISLYTATNYVFSQVKITQTLSIFIKRLYAKQTVHCDFNGFKQIIWYSIWPSFFSPFSVVGPTQIFGTFQKKKVTTYLNHFSLEIILLIWKMSIVTA